MRNIKYLYIRIEEVIKLIEAGVEPQKEILPNEEPQSAAEDASVNEADGVRRQNDITPLDKEEKLLDQSPSATAGVEPQEEILPNEEPQSATEDASEQQKDSGKYLPLTKANLPAADGVPPQDGMTRLLEEKQLLEQSLSAAIEATYTAWNLILLKLEGKGAKVEKAYVDYYADMLVNKDKQWIKLENPSNKSGPTITDRMRRLCEKVNLVAAVGVSGAPHSAMYGAGSAASQQTSRFGGLFSRVGKT